MIYLFSDAGLHFLKTFCKEKTLFAFDFDGTLAPLTIIPEEAKIKKSTFNLLKQLQQIAPTAVISGRSLKDLKSKLDSFDGYLVGNHGFEGIGKNRKAEAFRKVCKLWKVTLEHDLASFDNIQIEDKTYSLSVHYRQSNQKFLVEKMIKKSVSKLQPKPRIVLGKYVVNLLPIDAPSKGDALQEIMLYNGYRSAFYIGDDHTDEDIFSLPSKRIFTVRVGKSNKSKAKFYINRQSQINKVLKILL